MPIPYTGEEFAFHNPDGSELRVRGWGDQFAAVFETLDGYTVVRDPATGFYHYATGSADTPNLVASGSTARNAMPADEIRPPQGLRPPTAVLRAEARSTRNLLGGRTRWEERRERRRRHLRELTEDGGARTAVAPPRAGTTGSYVGLCVLVQFPDVPATLTRQQVEDFCNRPGYSEFGNNGSVFDYFAAVSDGRLRYTNRVVPYHTTKHERAYYTDRSAPYGKRAQELIVEALDALVVAGFDFSDLSSDDEGFVHALNVFYTGTRVNDWGEGLWPHCWALANRYPASPAKTFSDYQITDMGNQLLLRTFCHENGHMICDFPDLYDYGGESGGIGHYCLMCYGGSDRNPTQVSAYLKNGAGWTTRLTPLTSGMTATVAAGTNDFFIHRKSPTEYFIVENRQPSGRDVALPDAGLTIWHVDELGDNSFEQMTPGEHYECSLEQVDNRLDLERNANPGDATDLYGGPSAAVFGANTKPDSNWWNGRPSGLEIEQISEPNANMTFRVR